MIGPTGAAPAPSANGVFRPMLPGQVSQLRLFDLRCGGERVVFETSALIEAPNCHPDGQRIVVKLTHGTKTVKTRRATTGDDGRFAMKLKLRSAGHLVIRGRHLPSPQVKGDRSKPVRVLAFTPSLNFGSHGALTRLFQKHLAKMKYPASTSGVYDGATGRAVLAYRKVNGLSRVETPSDSIIRAVLQDKGAYEVVHPNAGHHVEADLSRQILALVDGDKVVRVEPVSSGKPSTPTVLGHYRFYSKTPGTNSEGMVYANYFIRGYAIHGYASVPSYNASHGCLRIPIPDAVRVYDWIDLGDEIFVEN